MEFMGNKRRNKRMKILVLLGLLIYISITMNENKKLQEKEF